MTVVALLRHSLRFSRGDRHSSGGHPVPIRFALLAFALTCALFTMLTAAPADAALTRVPTSFSPITGAGSGLTIEEPGAVAVDETSGNVFLNDGSERTDILGAEGGAPAGLAPPPPFTITGVFFPSNPNGNAFDNSASSKKGTVYVVSGSTEVKEFRRDTTTETYEAEGALPIPAPSSAAASPAVDSQGNLFVPAFESATVFKFDPAGALVKQYDLSAAAPVIGSVTVDAAGDLFAGVTGGGPVFKFPADSFGEINPSNFVQVAPTHRGIAVDPGTKALFILLENRVVEYDTATLAEKLEFGLGTLADPRKLAVNSTTNRVYVADAGSDNVAVFGPPVLLPTVALTPATGVTASKATLNGTVNPEGLPVTECFFEYGLSSEPYEEKSDCAEIIPADSANHNVSAAIAELQPDGATYHYRLVATNANGTARTADQTLVTANTVVTEAATAVNTTIATLNGTVFPEGQPFIDCKFEYGLTSNAGFEETAPCNPAAGSISPDFAPHAVSAAVTGLQPNAEYRFRLTAENAAGTASGEILTFRVTGPPQITEIRALNASQVAATIEAKIDPRSFQTNYFIEWGPTSAYSNRIPANFTEPSVGSGEQPIPVSATLSGLAPASTYHYRVVAKSNAGTTISADHELETLNGCETLGSLGSGLPEGRCFELVSPRDPGPVAQPGRFSPEELDWQASPQPGSLAYVVAAGLPGATRGAQVLYQATRGPGSSGWTSSQISPPVLARNETDGGLSGPSKGLGLSTDLSCAVIASNQPLTSDPTTRAIVEAGGGNLYRRNADGSYTAISNLPPTNPEDRTGALTDEYILRGFSANCGKVVFTTMYRYPGVPAVGVEVNPGEFSFTYEWENGVLRSMGMIPGPGGEEVAVPSAAGDAAGALRPGNQFFPNVSNAVSSNGFRVFFSAKRLTSPNSEEIGNIGVFVREHGTVTRDVSLSATGTPNLDATFQYATKDGSRVFFTANAGLTADTSAVGTDLYEYNLTTNKLTDLSVAKSGAADVAGFIGASEDGSQVYFVARGQLVPGKGKTFTENTASQTFSVYGASGGVVGYAGSVTEGDLSDAGIIRSDGQERLTSRVSSNGRYLLFESSDNVTGYVSGGVPEAYLYDAATLEESTRCISCRQDEKPSVTPRLNAPLGELSSSTLNPLYDTATLAVRNGKPIVFFSSFDRLAAGAQEGNANLYQWSHDQVFLIASAPLGLAEPVLNERIKAWVEFMDASSDATDLYFWIPAPLNWEDTDGRISVYSARIGGGFLQPPGPPAPCNPTVAGSCQGTPAAPPQAPNAGSTTFNGPGNPKPKKPKHKKHKKHQKQKKQKSKGQKKQGKKKQKGQKSKQTRQTSEQRRAGK